MCECVCPLACLTADLCAAVCCSKQVNDDLSSRLVTQPPGMSLCLHAVAGGNKGAPSCTHVSPGWNEQRRRGRASTDIPQAAFLGPLESVRYFGQKAPAKAAVAGAKPGSLKVDSPRGAQTVLLAIYQASARRLFRGLVVAWLFGTSHVPPGGSRQQLHTLL